MTSEPMISFMKGCLKVKFEIKMEFSLGKRIKCFPNTLRPEKFENAMPQSPRSEKSRDYRDVIVSAMLRFQIVE